MTPTGYYVTVMNAQRSGCGLDAIEPTALFHDLLFGALPPRLLSSRLVPYCYI